MRCRVRESTVAIITLPGWQWDVRSSMRSRTLQQDTRNTCPALQHGRDEADSAKQTPHRAFGRVSSCNRQQHNKLQPTKSAAAAQRSVTVLSSHAAPQALKSYASLHAVVRNKGQATHCVRTPCYLHARCQDVTLPRLTSLHTHKSHHAQFPPVQHTTTTVPLLPFLS